jgi:hypothetical protein
MTLAPVAMAAPRVSSAAPAGAGAPAEIFAAMLSPAPSTDAAAAPEAAPFEAFGVFGRPPGEAPTVGGAGPAGVASGAASAEAADRDLADPSGPPSTFAAASAAAASAPPPGAPAAVHADAAGLARLRPARPSGPAAAASPAAALEGEPARPEAAAGPPGAPARGRSRPGQAAGEGPALRIVDEAGRASEVRVAGLDLSDEEVRRFRDQARRLLQAHGGDLQGLFINGEERGAGGPDRRLQWR